MSAGNPTGEQACRADAIVERGGAPGGAHRTSSDKGHQLQGLLAATPHGPAEFGAAQQATVTADQGAGQAAEAVVAADRDGHV